jgi:hypothetical protein
VSPWCRESQISYPAVAHLEQRRAVRPPTLRSVRWVRPAWLVPVLATLSLTCGGDGNDAAPNCARRRRPHVPDRRQRGTHVPDRPSAASELGNPDRDVALSVERTKREREQRNALLSPLRTEEILPVAVGVEPLIDCDARPPELERPEVDVLAERRSRIAGSCATSSGFFPHASCAKSPHRWMSSALSRAASERVELSGIALRPRRSLAQFRRQSIVCSWTAIGADRSSPPGQAASGAR